ncbi:MAG: transketolase family protein [Candidatus Kaiserbacteria bacterium]|nr:transketolase family protein [Candidatus Kaiserbacteria bacterium]
MLEEAIHFHKKVFTTREESAPIREGYGKGLLEAAERDIRVVALCADLTDSTKTSYFKDRFPARFVEMGIGEQSMASVASGMAAMGKVPFFTSYAMFSPGRNWEQIRTTICYNNVNAKVVGSHAGVSVGPDGGTHQALEDIAIMRVIPRMTVLVPCDAEEARKATLAAAEYEGPVYIRLQREATPVMTTDVSPFRIGKAQCFYRGRNPKVTIFACGAMVYTALEAARELEEEKDIGVLVVNVPTIKPLDKEVCRYAEETGRVLTVEEHQRIGGLGSAVAEYLTEQCPMPVYRVGVDDRFGQSGEPGELLEHYQLSKGHIMQMVRTILGVKYVS